MIDLIIDSGNADYSSRTCVVKKTNILAILLIFVASFQWCIMQVCFDGNLTKWRTPTVVGSFILIILFLLIKSLNTLRIFNIIYIGVTLELLILGTGLFGVTFDLMTLCSMIITAFVYFYFLVIISSYFDSIFDLNPFVFLTTFFLNFIFMVFLIYMVLAEDPKLMLSLGRLVIVYTVTAMTVYHSVVAHRPTVWYSEVNYLRMGMLFFIDYICIFLLTVVYLQNDDQKSINLRFCKTL